MARRSIDQCRVLVTGASSGIGRSLVVRLHRQGARVLALARRADRLAELGRQLAPGSEVLFACAEQDGGAADAPSLPATGAAAPAVRPPAPADRGDSRLVLLAGDVTAPPVRAEAIALMQSRFGGIDVLVNNAGIGAMGLFEQADAARLRRIMEVNFFAAVEMIRAALPLLKESPHGMIVNVGSILGHRGVPHNSEYSASKFALHGFSESLRAELSRYGIDVLVVAPGTTETEFFDQVIERTSAPRWPEHKPVSADYVAKQTIAAIQRGRAEIVPYFWGKLLVLLNRVSPRLVDRIMRRYV